MPIRTIFFDLDDTLYPPTTGVWPLIRQRMRQYMHEKLEIPWEEIDDLRRGLFEKYGTTGRGLQAIYGIDEEDYLVYVHDVPIEERLQPDPVLKDMLLSLPQRKLIFTNADTHHARRVLDALRISCCFEQIIDIRQIAPSCKPQPEAYRKALEIAGETDPGQCLVIDDSPVNLKAAQGVGFHTILIQGEGDFPGCGIRICCLTELPQALGLLVKG